MFIENKKAYSQKNGVLRIIVMKKLSKSIVKNLSGLFGVLGRGETLSLSKTDKVIFTSEKQVPYGVNGKMQACLQIAVNGKDKGTFSVGTLVSAIVRADVPVASLSFKDGFTPSRNVTASFMRTLYKSE